MSLLSIMSYEVMPAIKGTTMGVNYGFDKLRFISPVRSGKRVRGRFVLAEAKLRKPNELLSRTNVTVEIEGEDKPALVADLARPDLFRLVTPAVGPGLTRQSIAAQKPVNFDRWPGRARPIRHSHPGSISWQSGSTDAVAIITSAGNGLGGAHAQGLAERGP